MLAGAVAACSVENSAERALADAVSASSGEIFVRGAVLLVLEGDGVESLVGQMKAPQGEASAWAVSDTTRRYDLDNGRMRVTLMRAAEFLWPLFGSTYVEYPFAENLLENSTFRGLDVERHVPIPADPLTHDGLERVMATGSL